MRLQVGYRLKHAQQNSSDDSSETADCCEDVLKRKLKGELIDIAIPYSTDCQLVRMWEDVEQYTQAATLIGGTVGRVVGQSIDVDVTNLDTFPLFKRSDAQYATSYVTQAN